MSARRLLDELRDDPAVAAELGRLLGAAPAVYSCQTLAAELGCTPRAVRAAIERGDLTAVRSGGRWVIGTAAVAAWATPTTPSPRRSPRSSAPRTMRDAVAKLDADGP